MLVSIAEVRLALEWGASRDPEIATLIAEVEAQFEQDTNRFWTQRVDEFLALEAATNAFIPVRPLAAVAIKPSSFRPATFEEADGSELAGTAFSFSPTGELALPQVTGWFAVKYSGGYTAETCPRNIKAAIKSQIKFLIQTDDAKTSGVSYRSIAGGASSSFHKSPRSPLYRSTVEAKRRYAF